jgi:excisionase family DNA binding protein
MTGGLLTAREVAERLGLSVATVLRWHRAGRLPAFRLATGVLRFDEGELERWVTTQSTV